MTIPEILETTQHRLSKPPTESWKYYQEWNEALFLHWQVELEELKRLVPKELEIDLFEGKAWVSIVAFKMERIRPKNLPSFPPISNFEEINIRTYVKSNDKAGVYFLSIEGGKKISCLIARGVSQLPYRYSEIERFNNEIHSNNAQFNDSLIAQFTCGEKIIAKTALDTWLTERYALTQDTEKTINEFEIHHLEWTLNKVDLKKLEFNYSKFANLIKGKPDITQYSEGVKVLAWGRHAKKRLLN